MLSNGYFDFLFRNFTMYKTFNAFYDSIIINGTISYNRIGSNGGEVGIDNYSIEDIFIEDEKVTNFKHIVFEMDKRSSIEFSSEISEVSAYPISDLSIDSKFSKLTLNKGEGTLRLKNHQFDIKAADGLIIEILPNKVDSSNFFINGTKIIFSGVTNSAKLNDVDILMSDFSYWLKYQPQIISGFGVLISAFLAALSFYLLFRNKIIEKKDEGKKILNVLLAEFETNGILLEDFKKSVNDLIEDNSKIFEFEFMGFRDDGFQTFRNQGGFQHINTDLYSKIVGYYNSLYRISKKSDTSNEQKKGLVLYFISKGELMQDIEAIETYNNNIKNELKNEIQKI